VVTPPRAGTAVTGEGELAVAVDGDDGAGAPPSGRVVVVGAVVVVVVVTGGAMVVGVQMTATEQGSWR
jgi:hypothetical protein